MGAVVPLGPCLSLSPLAALTGMRQTHWSSSEPDVLAGWLGDPG